MCQTGYQYNKHTNKKIQPCPLTTYDLIVVGYWPKSLIEDLG